MIRTLFVATSLDDSGSRLFFACARVMKGLSSLRGITAMVETENTPKLEKQTHSSFASFFRRAHVLHRTTQIVEALGILRPLGELVPGRAGRLLRAAAALDAKFAEQLFRFGMHGWASPVAWEFVHALNPKAIVIDDLALADLLARSRVDGPAILAHKNGEGFSLPTENNRHTMIRARRPVTNHSPGLGMPGEFNLPR